MSRGEGTQIVLSGVNEKVHEVLVKNNFDKILGSENICDNINRALARAGEVVGAK